MTLLELARRLRPIIECAAQSLDDEAALEAVTLYPKWSGDGVAYAADTRVRYGGVLYRVLQAHTSQETWTPDAAVSLFARVLLPGPDALPAWEQPESTNPYMAGDRVTHDGKAWASTLDNNVWEPGVYGWEEIDAHD